MTYTKKIFSVLLIFSLLMSALFIKFEFNASALSSRGTVTADILRIREEANTNSAEKGKVEGGNTVKLNSEAKGELIENDDGKSDIWYNITYNGITGWVSSIYISQIPEYTTDQSFETTIENFPESYKPYLRELHAQYPNWKFVADVVNIDFSYAVSLQNTAVKKQVQISSQPISWRSMGVGAYDWNTNQWVSYNGGWTGASREIIQYYMDPRNFLNSSDIYMFLLQSYEGATYTAAGLKNIVSGTFLDTTEYINIILNAGKQSGVNPYIIASKIKQEQGSSGTSALISGTYKGYEGYYNFFNWSASGSTDTAVIENGLAYAKNNGWNTKEKSIVEGAKLLAGKYISKGQDTYYYQDFDVYGNAGNQYAQAVHDAKSKGSALQKLYGSMNDIELTFKIPFFKNMPHTACLKPVENDTLNNYYFNNISVSGLTPSFDRFTYKYNLQVSDDTLVDISIPSTAYISCDLEFPLVTGDNTVVLKVRSESGYTTDYTIYVKAEKDCTLVINKGEAKIWNDESSNVSQGKGDINGDGKITVSDMGTIRLHLLGKYTITGDAFNAADINGDGKISVSDMGTIRLHLLGKYKIQ